MWFSYASRIDGGLGGSRNIVPLSVEGSLMAFWNVLSCEGPYFNKKEIY